MSQPYITIDRDWQRPDAALVERFRGAPSGNVSDAAGRVTGLPSGIKPVTRAARFCGVALTIDNGTTGNLGVWAALEHVRPGDVLVIATGGARQRAVIGDLLAGFAYNGGAVGIVTDGMIRDVETLDSLGKPVFAGGVTPVGPVGDGPCRIGMPITLGEQVVRSGDIIIGDADGVVVVPQTGIARALEELDRISAKEKRMEVQIKAGASVPEEAAAVLDAVTRTDLG